MKRKVIEPKISKDGLVYFGSGGPNMIVFNLSSDDFLKIHEELKKRGFRPRQGSAETNIMFELYCNELIKFGFDVTDLIQELNNAHKGDYYTLSHGLSLTKICYHYVKMNYDVNIVRTTRIRLSADIIIDNVSCELKVRHDQSHSKMLENTTLLKKGTDEGYYEQYEKIKGSLHEHLISALENRVQTAFRQADCIFIDLSSYFHTWNYHRIRSYLNENKMHNISKTPIAPVKDHCILFSPNNALDRNNPEFIPEAYWGYVKWNPRLRRLEKN